MSVSKNRYAIWLCIGVIVAGLGAMNWHLVHVAITSQPDCVAHLRAGDGDASRGLYSAAKSSCTPSASGLEAK